MPDSGFARKERKGRNMKCVEPNGFILFAFLTTFADSMFAAHRIDRDTTTATAIFA